MVDRDRENFSSVTFRPDLYYSLSKLRSFERESCKSTGFAVRVDIVNFFFGRLKFREMILPLNTNFPRCCFSFDENSQLPFRVVEKKTKTFNPCLCLPLFVQKHTETIKILFVIFRARYPLLFFLNSPPSSNFNWIAATVSQWFHENSNLSPRERVTCFNRTIFHVFPDC